MCGPVYRPPRWGCDGGPVRIVGPPRAVPPKGTLTLPFRQLIFGARLAGTEVKRGWRFFRGENTTSQAPSRSAAKQTRLGAWEVEIFGTEKYYPTFTSATDKP